MFDFIMENQGDFVILAGLLMAVGGIIVKLTPTKVDDAWWEKLKSFLPGSVKPPS